MGAGAGVRGSGGLYLPRLPPPRPPLPRPPPRFPILKPRGNGFPDPGPDPREPPLVKPRWLGGLLGPGGLKLDSAGIGCPCSEPDSKEEVGRTSVSSAAVEGAAESPGSLAASC